MNAKMFIIWSFVMIGTPLVILIGTFIYSLCIYGWNWWNT